jgi:2,4-diaminopentanoate dehydrogenase
MGVRVRTGKELMKPIRVVQYGLGPIGCAAVRAMLDKNGIQVVGAIDINPEMVGKDLGDVAGAGTKLGVQVSADAAAVFRKSRGQVVVHTTRSFFKDVYTQLEGCVKAGLNVVSSTEELLYPQLKNPALAAKMDRLAKRNGATLLGTGVNPGFVMDTLAVVLTGVCTDVRSIRIVRRVDASTRRMPLQRKVGAGMKEEEFRALVKRGKLGHIGLAESMALMAAGLNWKVTLKEQIEPMIAETARQTEYFTIAAGEVAGLKHTGAAFVRGKKVIDLDLRMYVGAEDPVDEIEIDGTPPLHLVMKGGVAGDIATVAALVNGVPAVLHGEPGLKTMLDLPVPRVFPAA